MAERLNDDVEEMTLVVELNGLTDTEFMKKDKVTCKVLGVDNDKPLLQLGTNIFSGEYKDVLGTFLLLEKKSDQDSHSSDVQFHCKTSKALVMHRTFLNEKTGDDNNTANGTENAQKDVPKSFTLDDT